MNQAEYERLADGALDTLFEQIDAQLGDWLEVDMEEGILQIELPDGSVYLINKHAPNKEIWLSSPTSGAWHFKGDGRGAWRSTRGSEDLADLLTGELSAASGRPVRLDF